MAVCGSRFGFLVAIAVVHRGQPVRLHIRVAFTGKEAEQHPHGTDGVRHEHRSKAQQRRQQELAERGDATPICDGLCSCHGREDKAAARGWGKRPCSPTAVLGQSPGIAGESFFGNVARPVESGAGFDMNEK